MDVPLLLEAVLLALVLIGLLLGLTWIVEVTTPEADSPPRALS
jgi:hypothetical protein